MNFKAKLAAYSLLTAAAVSVSPYLVQSDPITLEYHSIDAKSDEAKKFWGDFLPTAADAQGNPPDIQVAYYQAGNVQLAVSMIFDSASCTMNTCPLRVFENGNILVEKQICTRIDKHTIAESGNALEACGEILLIPKT